MDNFIAFAEVAGAIIAAMGLAMWLEWLTLNGLMRLMPPRRDPHQTPPRSGESNLASTARSKGTFRSFPKLTLFPH